MRAMEAFHALKANFTLPIGGDISKQAKIFKSPHLSHQSSKLTHWVEEADDEWMCKSDPFPFKLTEIKQFALWLISLSLQFN